MSALAFALVLMLSMPEFWRHVTPWNVWAADQVGQGLLVATAVFWTRYKAATAAAAVFGLARTGCTAVWPEASDAGGSICDAQIGLPLTALVLVLALAALVEMVRRE